MKWLVLGLLVACSEPDPCADIAGRCVALRVESATIERIDQLELDVLYGDRHGTATTSDGVVDLPLLTAVDVPGTTTLSIGIVAAGKLAGSVLGTGAGQTTAAPDAHVELRLVLAPAADCTAGAYYCGGDKLAGDAQTLYQCNGGGVPLARGTCINGCNVRPTQDDICDAGPVPCIEGGFYCGGNKLAGDPQSRYRCSGGVGVDRMVCADGCVIAPAGTDDDWRAPH
ncbi:MAG TPA: hypothetical protein VIV40_38610, partial [Kofleriaceae bacterium]